MTAHPYDANDTDDGTCPDCDPRSLCYACADDAAYSQWKDER